MKFVEIIEKFNPYHSPANGRFTSAIIFSQSASGRFFYVKKMETSATRKRPYGGIHEEKIDARKFI